MLTVRRALPWALLALGLLLHLLQLAGPIWAEAKEVTHGEDFASYYYAVQAAAQGLDPYDKEQLIALAREDGTRKGIFPFFYPPPFLLTMTWTLPMSLLNAYRTWFWADSLFLLAALLALYRWLPGPATLVGIAVILASFTPILDNHLMGQSNLPVLAAMLWGLYLTERDRPLSGGALLGLASMMKMSPALLLLWWVYRRKWAAVLSACAAAFTLSLAALPLVGWEAQLGFYRDVLPSFASGDYNGLLVSILHPSNHSVPNLWAQLFGAGRTLTPAAQLGAALTNLGLLGLLAWKLWRQTPDLLGAAAAAAAISGMMLLVPVYTYEHHLVQLIFPLIVALVALVRGRLESAWVFALAPAYLALAWWWPSIATALRSFEGPAAWLLQEAKLAATLVVIAACAIAATRTDGEGLRRDRLREGIERAGLLLLAAWAVAYLGRYVFIAYQTLGYPFPLEWMEGGTLDVVARIHGGEGAYVAPSVDYVAYIYTPFYFFASALSAQIFSVDFFAARMVSFAATLGSAALIYLLVHRETKSRFWGLVGVGLFMATYTASGKWFHLARVDSLGLFFAVAAFALLQMWTGWRSALGTGVLAWLSVFTKQTMLPILACVLLAAFIVDRRRSIQSAAAFALLSLASVAVLQLSSDGWFGYYAFWLPLSHESIAAPLRQMAEELAPFIPTVLLGLLWLGLAFRSQQRAAWMYTGLAVGCMAAAFLGRSHWGAYYNVLMPAHLVLALLGALAAAGLIGFARTRTEAQARGFSAAVIVLVLVQLGLLEYRVSACVPDPSSAQMASDFLDELKQLEGEVLLPDYRWVQTRVGKRSHGLGMAARDVLRSEAEHDRGRELLEDSLATAIREQRFSAVILSKRFPLPNLPEHYRLLEPMESPVPVTGARIHPNRLWLPRDEVQ